MNILVCITHVPDTMSRIAFTENNTQFDKVGVQYIIGPYDDYALARAVELKQALNGNITVLNVGQAETEQSLRKALAIGADEAIRVNSFPKDAFFVAKQIAKIAKEKNYDLILMGRESIDFNGGQVHGMVGELLNIPSLSPVMTLDIQDGKAKLSREIEGGKVYMEAELPLVLGCQEPIAEWKIPNMRSIMAARRKPLQVVEPTEDISATIIENYELPSVKSSVKMIDANNIEELVNLLKNEAKVI